MTSLSLVNFLLINLVVGAPMIDNDVEVSLVPTKNNSIHVEFRDAEYPPMLRMYQQLQHMAALKMFLKSLEIPKVFGDQTPQTKVVFLQEGEEATLPKDGTYIQDYEEDSAVVGHEFQDESDVVSSQELSLAKDSVDEAYFLDQAFAEASSPFGPTTTFTSVTIENQKQPHPYTGFLGYVEHALSTAWNWITSPFS